MNFYNYIPFKQRIKDALGFSDKEINEIEKDLEKENMTFTHKPSPCDIINNVAIPSIVGGFNASHMDAYTKSIPDNVKLGLYDFNNSSDNVKLGWNDFNNSPDFEVLIVGSYCKLEKDTNLYFKILDIISGILINATDNNLKLENLNQDKSFISFVERTLSQELHTFVKLVNIQTWKDYNTMKDLIKIGISITLDQKFIDSYVDRESTELINLAIG